MKILMEAIEVVDENNKIISKENRTTVHEKGLFHRGVNILILNSRGEFLLQQRRETKKICPLSWDISVAEHLKPGESYEDAAKRGLKEELGIENIKLVKLRGPYIQKQDYKNGLKDREFNELYKGVWNDEIKIDDSEVKQVSFFSFEDVEKLISEGKVTPWFFKDWKWIKENILSMSV